MADLLTTPTFALQGTAATGDLSPDGYTWAQCSPVLVDPFGVVIVWAQKYNAGAARNLPIVSNDNGATWSEPTRSGFFDGGGEGFLERGACAYDSVNDLLHVLWTATDPGDGVIYRRYSLTRNGSNGITGVTRVAGVNLQLDYQTTGSMRYDHPSALWIPEGGANGSLLCVWSARNTAGTPDRNEIRASMRALSNTTADNTAGNWAAPVSADTTGIGNAPAVAYSALVRNNGIGQTYSGIGRKASGTHAGDVYLAYYDGGGPSAEWFALRMRWNSGASNWSTGVSAAVSLTPSTVAGTDTGYGLKGQLQTQWAEDTANDRMVVGMPVWLSNAAGDTQVFVWVDAADVVSARQVVYSAGGAHDFAPTMDLIVDAASGATVVTYLTSGPPNEVYLQAFSGATQVQGPTACLEGVDFDIPLICPTRIDGDKLLIVGRDAVGGAPPYDGWAGTLTWAEAPTPSGSQEWWRIGTVTYNKAASITKSDTVNIPEGLTDAIYVGGAGIVVAVFEDGSTANFTCVAGQILPVKAKRVNSTTTTATLMVALYQV